MNAISFRQRQNKQLDCAFNKVLAGKMDVTVAQAAAAIINAKTRREEVEVKRAVKGGFVKELSAQWREEHLGPEVESVPAVKTPRSRSRRAA